jgi:Polysaccharide lyase
LVLALALIALLSLKPWEADPMGPSLSVSPNLGLGLDDAVAVIPAPGVRVAPARVAPAAAHPTLVDSRKEPATEQSPGPELGISAARAVQVSEATPPPSQPSRPQPQQQVPVEAPAPVPVATPAPDPAPVAAPVTQPQLDADFDRPYLQSVFDEDDGASDVVTVQVVEGEEYAFAFSFQILQMVYGEPGADNLIVHLNGDASEAPSFGLQLWDYAADEWQGDWRGLWASGEALGEDRFLAPVSEREWHDVIVHFEASSVGTGYYEVFLDGEAVDARSDVSLIAPGSSSAQVELGLFRDGERVQGTSEILFDAAKLGSTVASVQSE